RHSATVLQDGRVLVTGGGSDTKPPFTASAEVYDPAADTWTPAGSMSINRTQHTATLLDDGRVLIVGGVTGSQNGSINRLDSAEIYDPATNSWAAAAAMSATRTGHVAVKLASGKVLVMGGIGLNTTEVYDPATNSWSAGPNMVEDRSYFKAVTLPNDDILVNAGQRTDTLSNTSEILKP
ncbi:MAG: kelch-like protein, partial [SAR202 cluster bacterium]|nr:kelch-like protein [SAR202 cluster bacterium]